MAGEPWEIVEINLYWVRDKLRRLLRRPPSSLMNELRFMWKRYDKSPDGVRIEDLENAIWHMERFERSYTLVDFDQFVFMSMLDRREANHGG